MMRLLAWTVLLLGAFGVASVSASDARFFAAGNEVIDRQTGLTWQRCSLGQQWDGKHCAGNMALVDWRTANSAGRDGWRLPTVPELLTLIDHNRKNGGLFPAIDILAFPDMRGGPLEYWSADRRQRPQDPLQPAAMIVGFASSASDDVQWRDLGWHLPVRLVRSPARPLAASAAPAASAAGSGTRQVGSFVLSGDTALDRRTGLVWQRCAAGQTLAGPGTCGGVPRTYSLEESRRLGQNGWRLPTVDELKTLLDRGRKRAPLIDTDVFPMTESDPRDYWTATPYGHSRDQVFCVSFGIAAATNCGMYPMAARLVRSSR